MQAKKIQWCLMGSKSPYSTSTFSIVTKLLQKIVEDNEGVWKEGQRTSFSCLSLSNYRLEKIGSIKFSHICNIFTISITNKELLYQTK